MHSTCINYSHAVTIEWEAGVAGRVGEWEGSGGCESESADWANKEDAVYDS